jgi:hypothetical protein
MNSSHARGDGSERLRENHNRANGGGRASSDTSSRRTEIPREPSRLVRSRKTFGPATHFGNRINMRASRPHRGTGLSGFDVNRTAFCISVDPLRAFSFFVIVPADRLDRELLYSLNTCIRSTPVFAQHVACTQSTLSQLSLSALSVTLTPLPKRVGSEQSGGGDGSGSVSRSQFSSRRIR